MPDSTGKQEVVVTDIGMRFNSMVLFMVKWAVASIPALVILFVLAAVFGAIALGMFGSWWRSSLSGSAARKPAAALGASSKEGESPRPSAAESAYLGEVAVSRVTVGESALGGTGVFGEIKNTGDRTLKEVEITVYCLGSDGKPIFERTYDPVLVSDLSFGDSGEPLKPGYGRKFGVKMDDAPSDWKRKVDVKVTKVSFQ